MTWNPAAALSASLNRGWSSPDTAVQSGNDTGDPVPLPGPTPFSLPGYPPERQPPDGMVTWRARCSVMGTPGSGKRLGETGRAIPAPTPQAEPASRCTATTTRPMRTTSYRASQRPQARHPQVQAGIAAAGNSGIRSTPAPMTAAPPELPVTGAMTELKKIAGAGSIPADEELKLISYDNVAAITGQGCTFHPRPKRM